MERVPLDVVFLILRNLSLNEWKNIRLVNKKLQKIVDNKLLYIFSEYPVCEELDCTQLEEFMLQERNINNPGLHIKFKNYKEFSRISPTLTKILSKFQLLRIDGPSEEIVTVMTNLQFLDIKDFRFPPEKFSMFTSLKTLLCFPSDHTKTYNFHQNLELWHFPSSLTRLRFLYNEPYSPIAPLPTSIKKLEIVGSGPRYYTPFPPRLTHLTIANIVNYKSLTGLTLLRSLTLYDSYSYLATDLVNLESIKMHKSDCASLIPFTQLIKLKYLEIDDRKAELISLPSSQRALKIFDSSNSTTYLQVLENDKNMSDLKSKIKNAEKNKDVLEK